MLALDHDTLCRLQTATRTLLSPLAYADLDAWRRGAMASLRALFGADRAMFAVPGQPTYFLGDGVDPAREKLVNTYLAPSWSGTGPSPDPLVDVFHTMIVTRQIQVWDFPVIDTLLAGQAITATYYREVMVPEHLTDLQALFLPTPAGSAMIEVHAHLRPPSPGEHLSLLALLLPAFEAGLDAVRRLGATRAALDAAGTALMVFNPDGRLLHLTPVLERLLSADPHRAHVEAAASALARRASAFAFPVRSRRSSAPSTDVAVRHVETPATRYVLQTSVLEESPFGSHGAVLVLLDRVGAAARPDVDVVRNRHDLSKREAEVALLITEGLRNDGIAARLGLSPHTVRRHTERVMQKLLVSNRTAVAARLLERA